MKRAVWGAVLLSLASTQLLADPPPEKLVIATWNVEWFFDHYQGDNFSDLSKKMSAPNEAEWQWKLAGLARAIAQTDATVVALQEVEGSRVAYLLTQQLRKAHNKQYRYAAIQGGDHYTEQDVVFLYQSGLVQFSRREQTREMYDSKEFYNLQKHLIAEFQWGAGRDQESVTIMNVHFRAMEKAASIRQRQARLAKHWLSDAMSRGENVLLVGDLNTDVPYAATTAASEMGILRGLETSSPADDLFDLHMHIKPADRQTHLLPGKQFDRILVSRSMLDDDPERRDFSFQAVEVRKDLCVLGQQADEDHWNKYYQIPQRERDLSDHYPLVAEFVYK